MLAASSNVRVQEEQSGSYVLLRSSSQFDDAPITSDLPLNRHRQTGPTGPFRASSGSRGGQLLDR